MMSKPVPLKVNWAVGQAEVVPSVLHFASMSAVTVTLWAVPMESIEELL